MFTRLIYFLTHTYSLMHCAARHGPCVKQRPHTRTTDCILRGFGIFPPTRLRQKALGVVVCSCSRRLFSSFLTPLERLGVLILFSEREKRMGWTPSGLRTVYFYCFAFAGPCTGRLLPEGGPSRRTRTWRFGYLSIYRQNPTRLTTCSDSDRNLLRRALLNFCWECRWLYYHYYNYYYYLYFYFHYQNFKNLTITPFSLHALDCSVVGGVGWGLTR
jgi:hypothetical protein